MAEFILSIPDDQVGRVVDALCEVGGYKPGENDSVQARRKFAKSVLVRDIRPTVQRVERDRAITEAMLAVDIQPVPID